ncbi:MAG: ATP-dependent DNA helicase RecG [bacterium]
MKFIKSMLSLQSKISEINGIGKSKANKFKKLEIETVRDLIFYYPFRYDDFSQLKKISELSVGDVATIRAKVELIAAKRSPRQRKIITEALISDETDQIKIIWFNQPWIAKSIRPGDELFISGKVAGDLFNLYFSSPSYEKVSAHSLHTARLVPIYSLTQGLTSKQLRYIIGSALDSVEKVEDWLPTEIKKENKLADLKFAVRAVHFPESADELVVARRRLAWDELFLVQLWAQLMRRDLKNKQSRVINFFENETKDFVKNLKFTLTVDQKKVAWEILKDIGKAEPMNRLLEGDVGSGKTVVATMCMYNAVLNNFQSALMAPTEILATQHFNNLSKLFDNTNIRLGLATSSQKIIGQENLSKKDFYKKCENGEVDIIIGTHALIQKEVNFKDLALVIIDEQHRFGVEQREVLKSKGAKKNVPHFLSLTATPIPRSLALTLYGDLDLSIIKQMPMGRKQIITRLIPPDKRSLAYGFIRQEIAKGRQVFVICPRIDAGDKFGSASVKVEFEKLSQDIFSDLSVGLLHGKMKSVEKEKVMADFAQNKISILVATSVVEVGVDIPNATVMMIEGSERFGLSQLHQFRGRVGRGEEQAYCFLFSESNDLQTLSRLSALVKCHDGFELSQLDLKNRGSGQLYGYDQSGFMNFKIADLNDLELIKQTKLSAEKLVRQNSDLSAWPALNEKLLSLELSTHGE